MTINIVLFANVYCLLTNQTHHFTLNL